MPWNSAGFRKCDRAVLWGGLGAAVLLLTMAFPGKAMNVNASAWLPLHWAFGLASYGLFGAAVVHAALMTRAERQMRMAADATIGMPLLTLERLTFRFVGAGFVLLSATLLAGWWFGEQLYGSGHAWRWDHKTIFSLLSWLCFATLLFGRTPIGLARSHGGSGALRGHRLAAAGLCGFALCAGGCFGSPRMKGLLLLVVVLVGVGWWRLRKRSQTPPVPPTTPTSAERMVHCAHCGLHLPQTDAIVANDVFFCSKEHQLRNGA
jgi:hypothetical protein